MNDILACGTRIVLRKELGDYFRGIRFPILLGLVLLTSLLAAIGSVYSIRDSIARTGEDGAFLLLFTNSGYNLPSIVSFLSYLGPIVGLVLGFDAISGERARASLSRVLSRPIYRDTLVNAKYLAGTSVIALIMLCMGLGVCGLGMILTGLVPTGEELMRIVCFLLVTLLYISFWLAVSLLFSIVFRQSATSSLCSLGVWIFTSIFIGIIARGIAGFLYPVTGSSGEAVMYAAERTEYLITRISPSVLYSEAVNVLLNPLIRAVGPLTSEQVNGMVPGFMSFGQSLLLIWPHIVGICAAGAACFAIAYIVFSKQEIRA